MSPLHPLDALYTVRWLALTMQPWTSDSCMHLLPLYGLLLISAARFRLQMRSTPLAPSAMSRSRGASVRFSAPCWSSSTSWTASTPWATSRRAPQHRVSSYDAPVKIDIFIWQCCDQFCLHLWNQARAHCSMIDRSIVRHYTSFCRGFLQTLMATRRFKLFVL